MKSWMQKMMTWDEALCLKVSRLNGRRPVDRFMYLTSRLGDGYLYPVMAFVLLIFDFATAKLLVPITTLAFAIEISAQRFIKKRTRRHRPFISIEGIRELIKPPDEFSFPSGHTASAFVMASMLSHFYPGTAMASFSAASLIGVSRIYNGVHYPSDVLGGFLVGISSAQIGLWLVV